MVPFRAAGGDASTTPSPTRGRHIRRRSFRALVLLMSFVDLVPFPVSAHEASHVGDGVWRHVSFPVVLGCSAIIRTLGGVAVVYQSEWLGHWLPGRRFAAVVGAALIGLATRILIPLVTTQPGFALLSMFLGGLLAIVLPAHGETAGTSATTTVTASVLIIRQFLEGIVLATAYIAGGALGILAAIIITSHTVAALT